MLETVFCVIKLNKNIEGLDIFNHELLYTAYADDATFFLEDKKSVFEILNIFHTFSLVYGLKSYTGKCKLSNIGAGA